jgi:xanthine dehydrogenase accessory factor
MEVDLVERAKTLFSEPPAVAGGLTSDLIEQEHRKNAKHPSGMICSGSQTVVIRLLTLHHRDDVSAAANEGGLLTITHDQFAIGKAEYPIRHISFQKRSENDFVYSETLGPKNELIIIGGGHCALALSELMSKMDFRISIFDDRPELNTIEKNEFAHEITIIENYDLIADHIPTTGDVYVVVMTLGYKTDAAVIRSLVERDFKYFGVLGSKAKMATLLRELKMAGIDSARLDRIRTPIGIPINSRTPEEIAVSIAAEIISVKNSGPA